MSNCTHGDMTAHGNPCPWCRVTELEATIAELEAEKETFRLGFIHEGCNNAELEATIKRVTAERDQLAARLNNTQAPEQKR